MVVVLYRLGEVPLPVLFAAVAIGLYPLAKIGLLDLIRERKIGTEVFVTADGWYRRVDTRRMGLAALLAGTACCAFFLFASGRA